MFPAHALQDVLTQLASLENEHLSIISTKVLKIMQWDKLRKELVRRDDMVVPGGLNKIQKMAFHFKQTCKFSTCIVKGTH